MCSKYLLFNMHSKAFSGPTFSFSSPTKNIKLTIQHISFILTVNLGENMKFLETVLIVCIWWSHVGTRTENRRPA